MTVRAPCFFDVDPEEFLFLPFPPANFPLTLPSLLTTQHDSLSSYCFWGAIRGREHPENSRKRSSWATLDARWAVVLKAWHRLDRRGVEALPMSLCMSSTKVPQVNNSLTRDATRGFPVEQADSFTN